MPPEQREAKNATRTAFGADYEQRIRDEAGDEPEKKAKRKHQIHSLYHQAKMKVRALYTNTGKLLERVSVSTFEANIQLFSS